MLVGFHAHLHACTHARMRACTHARNGARFQVFTSTRRMHRNQETNEVARSAGWPRELLFLTIRRAAACDPVARNLLACGTHACPSHTRISRHITHRRTQILRKHSLKEAIAEIGKGARRGRRGKEEEGRRLEEEGGGGRSRCCGL